MEVTVYGIRHHGPGSARRLIKALTQFSPDCLLVELPSDSEHALSYINHSGLKPPVSLMVYDKKQVAQAAYLPFAVFSPEWQAGLYAARHAIPFIPMDLPIAIMYEPQNWNNNRQRNSLFRSFASEAEKIRFDPLGYVARTVGYSDGERWWEKQFENRHDEIEVFESILALMKELRKVTLQIDDRETLTREAHMRKVIRKTIKEGYQRIAIVCGAWHAPALVEWSSIPIKSDQAALRGLKKLKTAATWVPWSYDRLSTQAGYGAGVRAPAWYELLFSNPEEVVDLWMVKVARLLRKSGMDASPAEVGEASNLAHTLATLRLLEKPAMAELMEAAVTVFGKGRNEKMAIIQTKLSIGDKIGKVAQEITTLPILKDLEREIKAARLSAAWQTTEKVSKDLDLRKPTQLKASILIHRLSILDIPWGQLKKGSTFKTGSFSEHWRLHRKTDTAVRLVKAGMWGNTIEIAANRLLEDKIHHQSQLPDLTYLLEKAIKGHLMDLVPLIIKRLETVIVDTKDVITLMEGLPGLVLSYRYGNIRGTATTIMMELLKNMVPRIVAGSMLICKNLDTDLGVDRFHTISTTHQYLMLLEEKILLEQWYQALMNMAEQEGVFPLIAGWAVRLLKDLGLDSQAGIRQRFGFALSLAEDDQSKALWLEGFLSGGGALLVHDPWLWQLIDQWIIELQINEFRAVLPMLRRTFSAFSPTVKAKILRLAKPGNSYEPSSQTNLDLGNQNQQPLIQTLSLLLGFKDDLTSA